MANTNHTGYNPKSCNAIEKPFYSPMEAAIRWCELIEQEEWIFGLMGSALIPTVGMFPEWPCLKANAEKILDAIHNCAIPYGRNGATVTNGEQVTPTKLTIRHTDLREWMSKHYPDQKPAFLFDEVERKTHAAINKDTFLALQAERDAARAELEKAKAWASQTLAEHEALLSERDSLRGMVESLTGQLKNANEDTKAALMERALGALALGLAKDAARWRHGNKPNASILAAVALDAIKENEDGSRPYGYSERTINGAISAAIAAVIKDQAAR